METKFYTVELFFFFHYIFPMNTQENSLLFSVMLSYSSISRLINTKKKKNSKFEREDKSNGNKLVHHGIIFFLSLSFSYEHSEIFPTIFYYALLVFLDE